jgi:hypothetical protein
MGKVGEFIQPGADAPMFLLALIHFGMGLARLS